MQLIKELHLLTSFKKLGLSKNILKVLEELGFEKPTEIQEQSIPTLLAEDTDFIGLAQTGTGKTAAFGLPLLERIDTSINATQGLILAPTRELGKQIAEQLKIFSKYKDKVNVLPVYGGANISEQIRALKKTQHVIIATPGRLIDLIKRKAVKLNELEYLILDEADEMLNMGFKEEIDKILSYAPEEKITWLFSATMPSAIKKIVKKYMDDPLEVKVNSKNEVNKDIEHQYIAVKTKDKENALCRFLDLNEDLRGVVFCRTKRDTQDLATSLLAKNYKADALHGDLSQAQRDRVMKRFRKDNIKLLIATDVAARGIDVNDLTHVFHFSLPDDNAYYTHRSGRTARAGKKGISISFINGREGYKIKRLEQALGIEIKKVLIPDGKDIASIRIRTWAQELKQENKESRTDDELLGEVIEIFKDVSKNDLITKLVNLELKKLNIGTDSDLNDTTKPGDRSSRESRGRGGRGGGGGGRRDRRGGGSRNFSKKGKAGFSGRRRKDKKAESGGSDNIGGRRSRKKK